MKKNMLLAAACLAIFCACTKPVAVTERPAPAEGSTKQQELNAIRKVLLNQQQAWNRADVEAYMQGYWQNDSLAFIGKTGLTYGWNQTLANYRKSFPDAGAMGRLTFTILKNELLSPEVAYTIGKWHIARPGGPIQGYFTLVWKKLNGQWVIVSDHST